MYCLTTNIISVRMKHTTDGADSTSNVLIFTKDTPYSVLRRLSENGGSLFPPQMAWILVVCPDHLILLLHRSEPLKIMCL